MEGYEIDAIRYIFNIFCLFLVNEAEKIISVDFNLKIEKKKSHQNQVMGDTRPTCRNRATDKQQLS